MPGEGFDDRDIPVKEFDERTLNAARLHALLRQECGIEDPWHILAVAVCAFGRMHAKEGWEFVLTNKQDIEEVGEIFERASSPEEFQDGLIELKEQDLRERLEKLEAEEQLKGNGF